MTTKIKCPYCSKNFEPTEAYKHELEERLLREAQAKHQEEVKRLKKENTKLEEDQVKELDQAKKQAAEIARHKAGRCS
jgi:uncharacterized C2H2 Zn-finger protein